MNKQQPDINKTDCGRYSEDGTQFLRLEDNSITSYEVREGVTVIANEAFADCPNLKSVTLPYTLIDIGDMAFLNCESLKEITLPFCSVKSIGDYAFSGCSHLRRIVIPRPVESIGECAFMLCSSLKSVTLPSSLTYIGESAFDFCFALEEMHWTPNAKAKKLNDYMVEANITSLSQTLYLHKDVENESVVDLLAMDLADVFKKIIVIERPVIDFDKPWPESKRDTGWLDSIIRNGKSNLKRTNESDQTNDEGEATKKR